MKWLGRLLRNVHADERKMAIYRAGAEAPESIALTSPSFAHGAPMPVKHAGVRIGGADLSPALSWSGVPAGTEEFVLIMEDPDAPVPRPVVHAVAFAISKTVTSIEEGALSGAVPPKGFSLGKNSLGGLHYRGPGPVPGHGPHRYVFQLFALSRSLGLTAPPTKQRLIERMQGAVLAKGRLDGLYER